jgi:lysyl-tRNA synthetase, class II
MSLEEVRASRLKKLTLLQEQGIDPYPAHTERSHEIHEVHNNFSKLQDSKKAVTIAGRIRAIRGHGGSAFVDVEDGTGKIQVFFKKDGIGDESYDLFQNTMDLGDFIEVTGRVFLTKKEERTLEVQNWKVLTKTLLPLPEKWHGLQDMEERYRRRYLDLIMNEQVRDRFRTRSKIVTAVRSFFDKDGFLEVETPILNPIAGGALAKPFVTHHNALDIDLNLRIAPELYLKRLLVGGLDKVYEIGRLFRNEGIDHTHNPEFTTIEWYAAYWDEEDMMRNVELCFLSVLKSLKLGNSFMFNGKEVVFGKKFVLLRNCCSGMRK